jgi:hypothetical protein
VSLLTRRFATILLSVLILLGLTQSASAEEGEINDNSFNDYQIMYSDDDLSMKYGEYVEVEFKVQTTDSVEFEITSEMKPIGLQLVPMVGGATLLAGIPEFVEKFCFILEVKEVDGDKNAAERICLFSENNDKLDHPKFETQRHLRGLKEDQQGSVTIAMESSSSHVTPQFVQGDLPEGIEYRENRGSMELSGRADKQGVFEFMVQAHDTQGGQEYYVFKQFQLEVDPATDVRYQCDAGYYYDPTLGYCVQNSGSMCGVGEFWDHELNRCVRTVRPRHVTCRPGTYWDHFQYRCVRVVHYRCPYNYEYDEYYNRCVRLPYTCSIGYRYSWNYRSCIYVGYRRCGTGSHYDSYRNRCVRNYASCRPGQYWDGYTCRLNRRSCGSRSYWDPYYNRCQVRTGYRNCSYGYYYSYSSNRCVYRGRYQNRTCGYGTRYDHRRGGCVRVLPNRSRPHRRVRPTPVPPRRVRPTPPPHRPGRPTTRPAPRPRRPSATDNTSGTTSKTKTDATDNTSGTTSKTKTDATDNTSGTTSKTKTDATDNTSGTTSESKTDATDNTSGTTSKTKTDATDNTSGTTSESKTDATDNTSGTTSESKTDATDNTSGTTSKTKTSATDNSSGPTSKTKTSATDNTSGTTSK